MPVATVTTLVRGSLAGQPRPGLVQLPTGTGAPARSPTPLPVLPALRSLLPAGGLRRGSVVSVLGGSGATSLLLALLAGVSTGGGWCAAVGLPTLGPMAAAELGVDLGRLILVPAPGPRWTSATAGLLEAFDAVALRPPGRVGAADARRLVGRARERGSVLLTAGAWEGAELRMTVSEPRWQGLGDGHGRLRARCLTVRAQGRGAAARPRQVRLLLPAPEGGCAVAAGTSTSVTARPGQRPVLPTAGA